MIRLSVLEARQVAVSAQLLDGTAPSTVTEVVRALGSVQVDPVSAVARAERMVLFGRLGPYDVTELVSALDRGELFEYWAHIVPASDYDIHRESMRRYPRGDLTRERYVREWLAANASFRRYILRELRRRGPLRSRELEDRATVQWRTGGWNDGKALGRMLDVLWFRGDIAIAGREGNERVWDLAERRLPGTSRAGARGRSRVPSSRAGSAGEGSRVVGSSAGSSTVRRLAPTRRSGRSCVYVPAAKREYGYYVLPVLHGSEPIGRVDAAADRRAGALRVNGVWAERGAPSDAGPDVAVATRELAAWLGTPEVEVGRRVPRAWARALRA